MTRTDDFRPVLRVARREQRQPQSGFAVREHVDRVPVDPPPGSGADLRPTQRDARPLAEVAERTAGVVGQSPVQRGPLVALDGDEPFAGIRVCRRVQHDVRRSSLDDRPGPVPRDPRDRNVDVDRERSARSNRVRARRPKAEMDVVPDPPAEEPGPGHRPQHVADGDAVSRLDRRDHVEDARDGPRVHSGATAPVVGEFDDDQVIGRRGVRPVRTVDGQCLPDDAGDRGDAVVPGRIQVDRSSLLVRPVRRVEPRKPAIPRDDVGRETHGHTEVGSRTVKCASEPEPGTDLGSTG